MKVSQLRQVLEAAARMYRDGGNAAAAQSLSEIASLCAGRDAMTAASFSRLIEKAADVANRT
ncbi:MAG: hypothetical protein QOI12_1279 [Alphaproteobacteria bacterium]|jgi:hypothetical protein|nr:hypothetical protein [Alphaproteobacteria bacterium]